MAALAAAQRGSNPLAGMTGATTMIPASAATLGGYLPMVYAADPSAFFLDRYALAAAQNPAAVATSK